MRPTRRHGRTSSASRTTRSRASPISPAKKTVVKAELLDVSSEQLRAELAADLGRGGYVYRASDDSTTRYFDKYLVLSRPGLLTRAARLLARLLPDECERLAVTGVVSASLGAALSQETGVPLLLAHDRGDGQLTFGGESFLQIRTVLVEDVVFTGGRALAGARALTAQGAGVLAVLCLLDRQAG